MLYNYGVCCAVDSGFGKIAKDFVAKSTQDDVSSNKTTYTKLGVRVKWAATSMQQSVEWGMRDFQASFSKMKDYVDYEECGERHIVMKIYVLLFNLRSWLVGINQIQNVYMQWLEHGVNKEYTQNTKSLDIFLF